MAFQPEPQAAPMVPQQTPLNPATYMPQAPYPVDYSLFKSPLANLIQGGMAGLQIGEKLRDIPNEAARAALGGQMMAKATQALSSTNSDDPMLRGFTVDGSGNTTFTGSKVPMMPDVDAKKLANLATAQGISHEAATTTGQLQDNALKAMPTPQQTLLGIQRPAVQGDNTLASQAQALVTGGTPPASGSAGQVSNAMPSVGGVVVPNFSTKPGTSQFGPKDVLGWYNSTYGSDGKDALWDPASEKWQIIHKNGGSSLVSDQMIIKDILDGTSKYRVPMSLDNKKKLADIAHQGKTTGAPPGYDPNADTGGYEGGPDDPTEGQASTGWIGQANPYLPSGPMPGFVRPDAVPSSNPAPQALPVTAGTPAPNPGNAAPPMPNPQGQAQTQTPAPANPQAAAQNQGNPPPGQATGDPDFPNQRVVRKQGTVNVYDDGPGTGEYIIDGDTPMDQTRRPVMDLNQARTVKRPAAETVQKMRDEAAKTGMKDVTTASSAQLATYLNNQYKIDKGKDVPEPERKDLDAYQAAMKSGQEVEDALKSGKVKPGDINWLGQDWNMVKGLAGKGNPALNDFNAAYNTYRTKVGQAVGYGRSGEQMDKEADNLIGSPLYDPGNFAQRVAKANQMLRQQYADKVKGYLGTKMIVPTKHLELANSITNEMEAKAKGSSPNAAAASPAASPAASAGTDAPRVTSQAQFDALKPGDPFYALKKGTQDVWQLGHK